MRFLQTIVLFTFTFSWTNSNSKSMDNSTSPDTTKLEKTAEMLDEQKFWTIVEKSIEATENQDAQELFLISELENLTPKQIVGFRLRTDKLLYDTFNSAMWCAGSIMNGGCSDDGFEYFRCWVISRGRETYEKAKANPDYLINEVIEGVDLYDFDAFWFVSLEAFKRKTGKNLYDYIDYADFTIKEGSYSRSDFTWQEGNPKSMRKICPQLFEKFNN